MRRETLTYLSDMRLMAERIIDHAASTSLQQMREDWRVATIFERLFEILGEALIRIKRIEPNVSDAVPQGSRIIDMRNFLAHGYDGVDAALLWDTATRDVPVLLE